MKVKPYVILGLATSCAGVALATVVNNNDPYQADVLIRTLFWAALVLTVWGLVGTILTMAHQRLAVSLQIGALWAAGVVGGLIGYQSGYHDMRIGGGMILAVIVLSFFLWIRSKRSEKQPSTS